ncbi:MAG: hypothetical protein [Olavius algarvensis Gamma 1 endosymbiont]|nr:MAG: hypothetical protein [Olavius algarvensis Gamma 1 endosymbiont]
MNPQEVEAVACLLNRGDAESPSKKAVSKTPAPTRREISRPWGVERNICGMV